MALQGLDRATAPDAPTARRMLDKIGGRWWNVYIGGPESGGHGWSPELVKAYTQHGIDHFMLTYVGRQWPRGPLTGAQGHADALNALQIARGYGYSGNFPLCLDIELPTFEHLPSQTVEYAQAWCATVRDAGVRPGIYANPVTLKAIRKGKVPADFVWVASWVSHGASPHDPHDIPNLPAKFWSKLGARAWQYAGAYGKTPCRVLGLDVDISVADIGCLAGAPGPQHAARRVAAGTGPLRRGDTGERVERVTRRLSYVRSRRTGQRYLDGARRTFDAEAVAALRAFQREHRLDADGVFGRATSHALTRAVQHEKARGQHAHAGAPGNGQPGARPRKPAARPSKLHHLVHEVLRLEAATDSAWETLTAYGADRRRLLEKVKGEAGQDGAPGQVAAILLRIEQKLETLVAMEQRELAVVEHAPAPQPVPVATVPTTDAPAASGPAANGAGEPAPPPPAHAGVRLGDLTDEQLQQRIDRLDRSIGMSRRVLMRRYVGVEKELHLLAPARPPVRPAPHRPPHTRPVRPAPSPTVRPTPGGPRPGGLSLHTVEEVRVLQGSLNRFTGDSLSGIGPLMVDGKRGHATNQRIRTVKYYLGYTGGAQRSATVDRALLRRMRRPRSARYSNPAMLARGLARRRQQRQAAKRVAAPHAGVAAFDGRPVAAWLKPYLAWAREHGWQGTLQSGWRDPAYSEQLCRKMCGAPKCDGRCAGRSSHHVGRIKPEGAVDVSDYVRFGELMRKCPHEPKIFNALPRDPVHFSRTGR